MMRGRTASVILLLSPILLSGCLSDGPADVEGASTTAPGPPALLSVPFAHEGRTGASGCVLTPATLHCPYTTKGTEDPLFLCAEGTATRLQANLSWAASEMPPLEFQTNIFHRPAGTEDWTPKQDWGARSTVSPMLIDLDLTPIPGEEVMVHVTAWHIVGNDLAGVLVSQGEPFKLEGSLTCAAS